jgi:tetraacyldisaccharide 4'-kinase
VGNITVGGTGKTPHTELLVTLLRDEWQPAVLSRGYRRQTKGFRYVEATDTAAAAGDEPLQLKQKFPALTVAVDADRVHGIRRLMSEREQLDVIILDDAFQHRRVRPALSLLLIDYHRPPHRDHLLPRGRLRDRRNQLRRADIVCITKCPAHLTPEKQEALAGHLPPHLRRQLFFTTYAYGVPQPVFAGEQRPCPPAPCILLTGIAHPAPLAQYLQEQLCPPLQRLVFRDHHAFTAADARKITAAALRYPAAPILTTEKDAVRLRETPGLPDEVKQRLFFLPITVRFLPEESVPTPEGCLKKQEAFKKIITGQLWNRHPQPSNNF